MKNFTSKLAFSLFFNLLLGLFFSSNSDAYPSRRYNSYQFVNRTSPSMNSGITPNSYEANRYNYLIALRNHELLLRQEEQRIEFRKRREAQNKLQRLKNDYSRWVQKVERESLRLKRIEEQRRAREEALRLKEEQGRVVISRNQGISSKPGFSNEEVVRESSTRTSVKFNRIEQPRVEPLPVVKEELSEERVEVRTVEKERPSQEVNSEPKRQTSIFSQLKKALW